MTTTAKRLGQASLTGAAAAVYTCPVVTRAVIKSASITNTTAGAVAATVYIVPSGGSPAAGNTIISARSIAAGETYTCPELINHVLTAGDTLQALGNGLTMTASGAETV